MRKRIAFALTALSILFVLTATTSSVAAINLPAVKAGDTADYAVVGSPALPYSKTHIAILGTTGLYVALAVANYKPDGTVYSAQVRNWSVDQYGGGNWNIAVFFWVVGSNFQNGDEILTAVPGVFVQNNLTMNVFGASRFVLHANGGGMVVTYFDMYIDRPTGLVIQGNYNTPAGWINVTLTSTNVWSAPGGLAVTPLEIAEGAIIVALVIALVLVVILRKPGKK